MAHELRPHAGEPYLELEELLGRLHHVDPQLTVDREAGREHFEAVLEFAASLREGQLHRTGSSIVSERELELLSRNLQNTARVIVRGPGNLELVFFLMSGNKVLLDYLGPAHEHSSADLVARCAKALGYEIVLV